MRSLVVTIKKLTFHRALRLALSFLGGSLLKRAVSGTHFIAASKNWSLMFLANKCLSKRFSQPKEMLSSNKIGKSQCYVMQIKIIYPTGQ